MATWDIDQYDFNTEYETFNFGTRNIADGDNLYESSTLASFKCSDENPVKAPQVIKAVVKGGKIFCSINRSMKIFCDVHCKYLLFNGVFDDIIDTFAVSNDGCVLLVCLRNGCVHFVDVSDDSKIICTESITDNPCGENRLFVDCFNFDEHTQNEFVTIKNDGTVIRLSCDFSSQNTTVTSDVICNFNFEIKTASFSNPYIFVNGEEMAVYDYTYEDLIDGEPYDLVKIQPFNQMFIALENTGELIMICARTLLMHFVNNETLYKDFNIIKDDTKDSVSNILVVTEKDDSGFSYIQLLNYKDFSIVYSLKLNGLVHLIEPENNSDEDMFIMEVFKGDFVNELRIQVVYETFPEKRLKRLLKKRQFEEAESFASLFQLDKKIIKKAKAELIVDKNTIDSGEVDELLAVLDSVDDCTFSLECCCNMYYSCNKLEDVKKVLEYGCLSAQSIKNQCLNANTKKLKSFIFELSHKFETFLMLLRNKSASFDNTEWLNFSECDLFEEMISKLKNHAIEEAIIIYTHLNHKSIENLCDNSIERVLTILNNLPLQVTITFLNAFVPLTLKRIVTSIPIFESWLKSKVFFIERYHKSDFPENAIELLKNFFLFVKSANLSVCNKWEELTEIFKALKEIRVLRNNYKLNITLDDYLKGPHSLLITLLDVNITDDDYYSFLQNYVYKFICDNNMVPDEIFLKAIQDMIMYDEVYWIRTIPSILKCVNSVKIKLEATLLILNAASLPWSETIKEIATNCLNYTHPLVNEIKKKIEDEPKLLVLSRPVYKFNDQLAFNDIKFLINRIIYCEEPTMVEDIYCLCKNSKDKHLANLLLMENYIRKGELSEVKKILDGRPYDEIYECCKFLQIKIQLTMDRETRFETDNRYYYDIAGSVYQKLKQHAKSPFAKSCLDESLHNIQSVHKIKETFGKSVKIRNLLNKREKRLLLAELIDDVIEKFSNETADVCTTLHLCKLVSSYLGVDYDEVLIQFCDKLGDFDVVMSAAVKILEDCTNPKNLCYAALLILKYAGTCTNLLDNSLNKTLSSTVIVENDVTGVTEGLKIAEKLAVKAILCSVSTGDSDASIQVLTWIQTTFFVTRSRPQKNIFEANCFDVLPTNNTFETVKDVFALFVQLYGVFGGPNVKYLKFAFADIPKFDSDDAKLQVKELPLMVHRLCSQGQHFTAHKLVATLQDSLKGDADFNSQINNVLVEQCTSYLLQNIFCSDNIDKDLAFNLLISYDLQKAGNFLKHHLASHKRNIYKLKTIAEIAIRVYNYYETKSSSLWKILMQSKWWMKINNNKIPHDAFFKTPPNVLVEKLLSMGLLNVKLLPEFCFDFNLDLQSNYIIYLKGTLLNWKPKYEIKVGINGRKKLLMNSDESELFKMCTEIIDVIDNKSGIPDIINTLWAKVNSYYYEVFLCMLKLLSELNKEITYRNQFSLFEFLKSYERISKPSELEEETWYTAFPDTQSLDELSEFRFPYSQILFTKNIWDIVKPEINLRTYKQWFTAIDILKNLNKDDICSYVVKDVVSSKILQQGSSEEWVFYPKHENLFYEIDVCLQNIQDLEKASSAIYHLMKFTPKGADQVNAAKLCYKYILKYKESSGRSPDIEKAVAKVHNTYLNYSAMHILHVNHLAEQSYLQLTLKPQQLIEELYSDERILKKSGDISVYCPNINKATNELGKLFGKDINAIRTELLNGWLSDFVLPNINESSDETSISNTNNKNLKRAAYLCTENLQYWQKYLLSAGLDSDSLNSTRFKARALSCFLSIADDATVYNSTGQSREMVLNYTKKLLIVSDLEHLGLNLQVSVLDNYNKIELIRRLALYKTKLSVRIIASVCKVYEIYNVQFWKLVLESAITFNMVEELNEYVTFLKGNYVFTKKDFYKTAWQRVLDCSFESCRFCDSEKLQNKCIEIILNVQTCPLLYSLNFEPTVNILMGLKQPQLAALLTQYLCEEKQREMKNQLQPFEKEILKDLDLLQNRGLWGVNFVKKFF